MLLVAETLSRLCKSRPWGLVAALFSVLLFVPLESLWQDTIATGGDVGAHVWYPRALAEAFPFLHTYSNDWFAGVPVGYFYFPVPAVSASLLGWVIGYNVAFKVVLVSGLFLLPLAAWRFATACGTSNVTRTIAAFAAVGMLQERFYTIFGGNIASTGAGMYSYQVALALSVLAAADFIDVVKRGEHRVRAAVLFAFALCSHVLAGVIAPVLVAAVLLAALPYNAWRSRLHGALSAIAGGALAACWWLPFLLSRDNTIDMGYETIRSWRWMLPIHTAYPSAASHNWHWWGIGALALASLAHLRSTFVRVMLVLAATSALLFWFAPRSAVWNVRWLPTYYLACWMLAAYVLGQLVPTVKSKARSVTTAVAVCVALVPLIAGSHFPFGNYPTTTHPHRGWLGWDLAGYQAREGWAEYSAAMEMFRELGETAGCGRLAWEYDTAQGSYGTPLAMFLVPYFTNGCVSSIEGLYYEASPTTPFYFGATPWFTKAPSKPVRNLPYPADIDLSKGMSALDALGARWYATFNDSTEATARAAKLVEVAASGPWTVFEVPNGGIVSTVSTVPTFRAWDQGAYIGQFLNDPTALWSEWDTDKRPNSKLPTVEVSNVKVADGDVRFNVDKVNVPVIVHMSHFEGWRVDNGELLGRVGPNMLLVLPHERSVRVHWERPLTTYLAYLISGLGLAALVLLQRNRYRLTSLTDEQAADQEHDPDTFGEGTTAAVQVIAVTMQETSTATTSEVPTGTTSGATSIAEAHTATNPASDAITTALAGDLDNTKDATTANTTDDIPGGPADV
jgi:hypothetical protein